MNYLYQKHQAAEARADPFKSHLTALLSSYDRGPVPDDLVPTYEGPSDEQTEAILRALAVMAHRMWAAEDAVKKNSKNQSEDDVPVAEGAADATISTPQRQRQSHPNQILGKTSEFLFNMSHVICNPVMNIIELSELVLDTDLNRAQRENLLLVHSLARSLLLILDDVMDLSKIETGLKMEAVPYSLRQAVFDTLKTLVHRASGNNLRLIYEVDSAIPDHLVGDSRRLKQVISKLVSNAIKYSRSTTPSSHVAVSARLVQSDAESATLEFCVADSGIGIEKSKLDGIFDHLGFEKNEEYGGIGLGLFLSKRLVSLMRGNMWVESEVSKGSKFFFNITCPIARSKTEEIHRKMESFSKHRVIFADTLLDQTGVVDRIRELGLEPLVVHDISELADKEKYSYMTAILVDSITEIDSIKNFEHVRYHPIILITPSNPKLDMKWCLDKSISSQVTTPVTAQDLSVAFVRALESNTISLPASAPNDVKFDILLAEDNRVNQRLAEKILEKYGHSVEAVDNGSLAVDAFKARMSQGKPFDIILLSLSTPFMDGFEAATLIRKYEMDQGITAETPIIAMARRSEHYKQSSSEDPNANAIVPDEKERCLQAGMNEYITKPLRRADLLNAINKLLGQQAKTK